MRQTLLEKQMEAAPLRDTQTADDDTTGQLGSANVRGRKYYN